MKTSSILKRLSVLPLSALIAASCTSDHKAVTPVPHGDDATVTLALNVPGGSSPSTRGLSDDDETNVETVDMLLFRKDGNNRLYWGRVLGVSLDNAPGSTKTFKAVIPVQDYKNYDITVIANGRDMILSAGLLQGDEKSAALNKLVKTVPADQKWNSNMIPMWGEALDVNVNENTSLSGDNAVRMTRMIARIDIKLTKTAATGDHSRSVGRNYSEDTGSDYAGAGGNANFELVSARLYNHSTRGTLVPDLANGWENCDSPHATSPNRPAGGYGQALFSEGHQPLVYTANDQHPSAANLPDSLMRVIYTLEAPKGSGATLETNTCLVIGGRYRGDTKETFYRIDFAQKNTITHKYEYLDVLRNFRYIISITRISGAGFVTPEEAFSSHPVNIEADVIDWDEWEIGDIIFDGQSYLGVSPTVFSFYRDATEGNKITIATDVRTGWKIDGVTDSNQSGAGNAVDWIYDFDGSFSSPGSKDNLTFKVKENETGTDRCAWIHIKAARLNFAVKVTQGVEPDPRNYWITITDTKGSEIDELVFTGKATDTPLPQDFNVHWNPSGSLLKARVIPDGGNPLAANYAPELTANWTNLLVWNPQGQTFNVSVPLITSSSSEPFFEKSTRILFELQTPEGPITKILSIRQANFNLIPQIGTMLMDGSSQSFGVLANFTWKAEYVGAYSEDNSFTGNDIVKTFSTQYGGNNTTTGDRVSFACRDFISNYKDNNPKKAVVQVKFSKREKGQWIEFGIYDITCYAAIPVGESNCYMIDNKQPLPILIPTSQIDYTMKAAESGFLGSGWIEKSGNLKAQVLWSDIDKFDTADAVVKTVSYNGAASVADGRILLIPGSEAGNSLVILYEDNNGTSGYQHNTIDKIRWSWHIWNTDYHPYDAAGNPYASGTDNRWMNRNLGAMSNTPGNVKSMGFMYQWGRKDPFPSNDRWSGSFTDYLYYAAGSGVKFDELKTPTDVNLPNSILNPLTRYFYPLEPFDWFTTNGTQNDNLWGGAAKADFMHASGKSAYDPCPEGYRIPDNGAEGWGTTDNESSWMSFANYGRININYGGYYPASGGRRHDREGLDGYTGGGGYYWQAIHSSKYGYYMHTSDGSIKPNVYTSRAYGFSVRCVRE